MKEIYREIRGYIDAQREAMLALWERIVNVDSGSRQIEGVNKVCGILKNEMEQTGMTTQVIPMENAGNILIGEWNTESDKAPLLLIGHMDTVFQEGAAKDRPFRVDEMGYAYGPGVLDMKAGLVMAVYLVKALRHVGWNRRPIKCIFAGDEENLHMFSNAKEVMAREASGALAAFNFETGYMDDRLVTGRKGGGIYDIEIKGVASHSGIAPEKGRSAILEAAYKIIEIEGQNDISRGRLMNCGIISGGIGENVIPDKCVVKIGVRFPSMAVKGEIEQILMQAVKHSTVKDVTAELKERMGIDCMETTRGVMSLFGCLERTARECGFGTLGSFAVGGVSDSGIMVVNGVPTVCGMGPRGMGNHTEHEFADVESLYQRCILAACTAAELEEDFAV